MRTEKAKGRKKLKQKWREEKFTLQLCSSAEKVLYAQAHVHLLSLMSLYVISCNFKMECYNRKK